MHPKIISVGKAVPPHEINQTTVKSAAKTYFGDHIPNIDRIMPVFTNAGIDTRYLCIPLDWYEEEKTFKDKNNAYIEWAVKLSREAITICLSKSDYDVADIDYLIFVSTIPVCCWTVLCRDIFWFC